MNYIYRTKKNKLSKSKTATIKSLSFFSFFVIFLHNICFIKTNINEFYGSTISSKYVLIIPTFIFIFFVFRIATIILSCGFYRLQKIILSVFILHASIYSSCKLNGSPKFLYTFLLGILPSFIVLKSKIQKDSFNFQLIIGVFYLFLYSTFLYLFYIPFHPFVEKNILSKKENLAPLNVVNSTLLYVSKYKQNPKIKQETVEEKKIEDTFVIKSSSKTLNLVVVVKNEKESNEVLKNNIKEILGKFNINTHFDEKNTTFFDTLNQDRYTKFVIISQEYFVKNNLQKFFEGKNSIIIDNEKQSIFVSKSFKKYYPNRSTLLIKNGIKKSTTDDLFHSILGCFDIHSKAVDQAKNICKYG